MLNEQKLIQAQTDFLERHPGGFADPQMLAVAKKHRMDKLVEFAAAAFSRIAYPEMMKVGYKQTFALGAVAGSACLGMLIPPSVLRSLAGE